VADITNVLQVGVANMAAPQADVPFSRRNSSRASLSSLDQSGSSVRSVSGENLTFSSTVVDSIVRKVQKSGLLPDQVSFPCNHHFFDNVIPVNELSCRQLSGLYTFCCDNAGVISGLPIPHVSPNAAIPPIPNTLSRVRSRGDLAVTGMAKSPSGHFVSPPVPGTGMAVGRISRPGSASTGVSPHQTGLPSPFGIFGTPVVLPSPLPGLQLSPQVLPSPVGLPRVPDGLFGQAAGNSDPFSRSALSAMLSGFAMHDSDDDASLGVEEP
jgi:hypothetical protein